MIRLRGVGPAKAVQLMAGIELGQRISRLLPEERYAIRSPEDAALFVMDELRFEKQELFVCLFLNTKYRVMEKKVIFKGSLNTSVVHPRAIFHEAIRSSAAAIVLRSQSSERRPHSQPGRFGCDTTPVGSGEDHRH
jgi:DNA repair protein RadC